MPNIQLPITNQAKMTNDKRQIQYDLEERTSRFGITIIQFCKKIKENTITRPLISQLIRSATSIGANYCEADNAESKKDFVHKIAICKKEAKETKHWINMLVGAVPEIKENALPLWQEAKELTLIFNAITISTKK